VVCGVAVSGLDVAGGNTAVVGSSVLPAFGLTVGEVLAQPQASVSSSAVAPMRIVCLIRKCRLMPTNRFNFVLNYTQKTPRDKPGFSIQYARAAQSVWPGRMLADIGARY
jgi:hypothetical protein